MPLKTKAARFVTCDVTVTRTEVFHKFKKQNKAKLPKTKPSHTTGLVSLHRFLVYIKRKHVFLFQAENQTELMTLKGTDY